MDWEKTGPAWSWTFPSRVPHARAGIFAGKQGLAPGTAPSYLAGVFSPWKSVSGLSLEAACIM